LLFRGIKTDSNGNLQWIRAALKGRKMEDVACDCGGKARFAGNGHLRPQATTGEDVHVS